MRRFSTSGIWLKRSDINSVSNLAQFIALFLAFPSFKSADAFFKPPFLRNQRGLCLLGLQE